MDFSIFLQLLASGCTLLALWLFGNKHPHGPVWALAGDCFFVALNLYIGLWVLVLFTLIVGALHTRALFKWRNG